MIQRPYDISDRLRSSDRNEPMAKKPSSSLSPKIVLAAVLTGVSALIAAGVITVRGKVKDQQAQIEGILRADYSGCNSLDEYLEKYPYLRILHGAYMTWGEAKGDEGGGEGSLTTKQEQLASLQPFEDAFIQAVEHFEHQSEKKK